MLVFHWVCPTLTTMTKLLAGWPASLTQMSAGFTATVCGTSNLCSGQRRSRILRCFQIVALIAVLFVDCEEYLCILVGFFCQVLVMQSFTFSFRLNKVGWLSSSFRICCKNPIIRNLNSISSRGLVDVRLQGGPVVQYDVVFSPSDVRQRLPVFITGVPS